MSELAANQLRQARRVARSGDAERAVELLEQARVLVGDDEQLKEQVLAELADQYDAVGRREEARQCRAQIPRPAAQTGVQLGASGTAHAPMAHPPPSGMPEPGSERVLQVPVGRRVSPVMLYAGIATGVAIVLILLGVAVRILLFSKPSTPPDEEAGVMPSSPVVSSSSTPASAPSTSAKPVEIRPAVISAIASSQPATLPAPIPASGKQAAAVMATSNPTAAPSSVAILPPTVPRPVVVAPRLPATAPAVSVARVVPKIDREDLLKETVGLCVLVAHYEGLVRDTNDVQIDMAIGSGTAFSIDGAGLMLTNRHVVDLAKDAKVPTNLEKFKLPTVTRRKISYIVCFGPDPKDRYVAKLLHRSEQYDLAVLKIDRHVEHPLVLAQKMPRQGDDILVCGYPGAVMAALNDASDTPAQDDALRQKWVKTLHVGAFDTFSPDSFSSTLTKGIVSAPDRNVEGAGYLQIDAGISPGNSGGPVLNVENEVVGIATWGLRSATGDLHASYNFALRVGQLLDDVQPYMKE